MFVVGQSYEEGIIHLVNYLADKNPGKKWGLITQDDDYGITVRDGFDTVVKAKKLNVVYSGNYKKGQQDFSSDMLQLKDSGAEVFLAGGIIGENIAMMKELEKLNIKPVIGIFWPGRVEPVLKLMGPAGDGIYAVDYVEPFAGAAGKAFLEKAKAPAPGSRDERHQPLQHDRLCRRQGPDRSDRTLRQGADLGLHHRGAGEDQERRDRRDGADQLRPRRALLEPEAADHAVRVLDAELQAGELSAQR